jgi:quercetin dioxygenase-like cupin family protein
MRYLHFIISMNNKIILFAGTITASGLSSLGLASNVAGRPSGIKRTELPRHDLSTRGREAIQVRIDFDQGTAFGRHSHPGEEVIYVIEGLLEYHVEGKGPVTLKAGDVLFIPAGTIHSAKNVGKGNAGELATYIVEKGKPLVVLSK